MDKKELLKERDNTVSKEPNIPLVLTYSWSLPSISKVFHNYWKILSIFKVFKETFENKPVIAFRRKKFGRN